MQAWRDARDAPLVVVLGCRGCRLDDLCAFVVGLDVLPCCLRVELVRTVRLACEKTGKKSRVCATVCRSDGPIPNDGSQESPQAATSHQCQTWVSPTVVPSDGRGSMTAGSYSMAIWKRKRRPPSISPDFHKRVKKSQEIKTALRQSQKRDHGQFPVLPGLRTIWSWATSYKQAEDRDKRDSNRMT